MTTDQTQMMIRLDDQLRTTLSTLPTGSLKQFHWDSTDVLCPECGAFKGEFVEYRIGVFIPSLNSECESDLQ